MCWNWSSTIPTSSTIRARFRCLSSLSDRRRSSRAASNVVTSWPPTVAAAPTATPARTRPPSLTGAPQTRGTRLRLPPNLPPNHPARGVTVRHWRLVEEPRRAGQTDDPTPRVTVRHPRRRAYNQQVGGSSPSAPTTKRNTGERERPGDGESRTGSETGGGRQADRPGSDDEAGGRRQGGGERGLKPGGKRQATADERRGVGRGRALVGELPCHQLGPAEVYTVGKSDRASATKGSASLTDRGSWPSNIEASATAKAFISG